MAPSSSGNRTLLLRGVTAARAGDPLLRSGRLSLRAEFRLDSARTAPGRPTQEVEAAEDDILELEFEDGALLWMTAAQFRDQFQPEASRSADDGRLTVDLPSSLQLDEAGASRGAGAWVLRGIKLLGFDAVGLTAAAAGHAVETRGLGDPDKRPGLGLFRCAMEPGRFQLRAAKAADIPTDRAILVFLHGTASSNWGSFGDLWDDQRREALEALRAAYGEAVFAFEHRSLTESPIRNARDLVRALPPGARLHLVSHSRGGLIGELLARARHDGAAPFTDEDLALFAADGSGTFDREPAPEDLDDLRALAADLADRRIRVTRFVRVACPALGTTLASRRLDRWLSIVGTAASVLGADSPVASVFGAIGDFMAAVIKERTDPTTLPGLEAMMPDSRLVHLVNRRRLELDGELLAIAGDIEPTSWWRRVLVFGTDRYYGGEHDLVVNTPSMRGGAPRPTGRLAKFRGPQVNHFSYFQEQGSVEALVRGLTGTLGAGDGFSPIVAPSTPIARTTVARSAGPQPTVFVLPGIMGSELSVGDNRVWADLDELAWGGMRKLSIEAEGVHASNVFGRYYGRLVEYLAGSHRVVTFPFDWRQPLAELGDELANEVEKELELAERAQMPVRFIAHSMGGLVVRTMIARHGDLWSRITRHPGARFVMLGTPNSGSHAITELLVGRSRVLKRLALLDLRDSKRALLEIVARYPGLLAMLPKDDERDWFSPATWTALHAVEHGTWIPPSPEDLERARRDRQTLDRSPLERDRMLYVAGHAAETVADLRLEQDGNKAGTRLQMYVTPCGDGRVTWDKGIPPGLPCWYTRTEHGDLAADPGSFAAYLDLLERGDTSQLPTQPVFPRSQETLRRASEADVDYYPADGDDLLASAMGAESAGPIQAPARPKIPVSVAHGDLVFARSAVAVGHYEGDTIISAEKALDWHLDQRLSRHNALNLYPGPIGSSAVFMNTRPGSRPEAAIVIGLGRVGDLSPGALSSGMATAVLKYAMRKVERSANGAGAAPQGISISPLLIGTGAGGMSVKDALQALLLGVKLASDRLARHEDGISIQEIQFIELWEDRAKDAVEALQEIGSDIGLGEAFSFCGTMETLGGGLRRLSYGEPSGWWQRLQIKADPGSGSLIFTAPTRRARTERLTVDIQPRLIEEYIADSITTTSANRQVGRTLFELLVPNEFKNRAREREPLVLEVEEATAAYPWELIEDRESSQNQPVAIERGLLRRLEVPDTPTLVQEAMEPIALVVGEPGGVTPALPGAAAEAEAVVRDLRARAFRVVSEIGTEARSVISALHARPYRVLHLAGHGIYSPADPVKGRFDTLAGMVLSGGAYLTPKEIGQMREVPALVFVNCCHLGAIGPGQRQHHRLASNLAGQFIKQGVRAIVAAGWAVDDAAAKTFAGEFYRKMLNGATFGDAVLAARRATWERHGGTNTWGAYQCYGDPGFRLLVDRADGVASSSGWTFVSLEHAMAEIENITAKAANRAIGDMGGLRSQLHEIEKQAELCSWIDDSRIRAALGCAWAETGALEEGIKHLTAAMTGEKSQMSLRHVEQLANYRVRDAGRRAAEADQRESALSDIDQSIGLILWLIGEMPYEPDRASQEVRTLTPDQIAALHERKLATSERLCLLGSAFKRRAMIDPETRAASLELMVCAYRHAVTKDPTGIDFYPLTNWIQGTFVVRWLNPRDRSFDRHREDARNRLAVCRSALRRSDSLHPDFWSTFNLATADLLDDLLAGRYHMPGAEARVADYTLGFREAQKRGSRRQLDSAVDHLDFVLLMLAETRGSSHGAKARRLFAEIRRGLDERTRADRG